MGYYYIKPMADNVYNHYKYQYLDHISAIIDLKENYWQFYMQLFCINNCLLPVNTLNVSIHLPYQEVKSLSFNLASDQSQAQSSVSHNAKYCKIFENSFNVDVSQNQYFKQDINNQKISILVNLDLNPEPIKASSVDYNPQDLDGLFQETCEQKWNFSLYYSNTYVIKNNQQINNQYGYTLPNGDLALAKTRLVELTSQDYSQSTNSIINLVEIKSPNEFQLVSCKVKFYYWLDLETEAKNIETNILVDKKFSTTAVIKFTDCTLYDFVNNKAVIDPSGIQGFYIPKYAHGYYEIELLLSQEGNTSKFVIKNDFNFIKTMVKPYIGASSIFINDLKDFRKVNL